MILFILYLSAFSVFNSMFLKKKEIGRVLLAWLHRENFLRTILFLVSKTGNFHKKQLKFLAYLV